MSSPPPVIISSSILEGLGKKSQLACKGFGKKSQSNSYGDYGNSYWGKKSQEIIDRLPFDGAIHIETIGFIGGLWLLWNSDMVEIEQLATTE